MAKCNLGKVKIKPMLVAGCIFWGQITLEVHVTRCRVVARGWHPLFAGMALCLCVANLGILLIVADQQPVFMQMVTDSSRS